MFSRISRSGLRAVQCGEGVRRFSKKGSQQEKPKMPACDFEPSTYNGPDYGSVQKIKEDHVMPCIQTYYKEPLLIHQGHMQWLFDHKGNRYLDMFGGIVTVSVGHCHPKINEAAKKQMETLWHTTNVYLHPKLYEYAEKLTAKFPDELQVVYFVNSGSEANDLAMLLARVYTGNYDIVSLQNGYHGVSPYCMGLTAMSTWKFNVPTKLGLTHAMVPDPYKGLFGGARCRDSPVQPLRDCACAEGTCAASQSYYEQLEETFKYSIPRGKVAAFFAESMQGVGGVVQYPKGFLKKAYELVRSNGGLCVADEVQTGFARTGDNFWGFESHGVVPDIVTLAKGIGNGYPLAAVVTSNKISRALGHANHFNTFGGNPVACAIGIATLDIIEEEKLQRNSKIVGNYLLKGLERLRSEFDIVGDVRGKGLIIGLELVSDKKSKQPLAAKHVADVWETCKDMGVLLGRGGFHGNVFRIKPPMCISIEDAEFTLQVLRCALVKISSKPSREQSI